MTNQSSLLDFARLKHGWKGLYGRLLLLQAHYYKLDQLYEGQALMPKKKEDMSYDKHEKALRQ